MYQRRTWEEFKRVLSLAQASEPVERAENLEYRNQLSGVCWGAVYSSNHTDLRSESIFLNHSVYYNIGETANKDFATWACNFLTILKPKFYDYCCYTILTKTCKISALLIPQHMYAYCSIFYCSMFKKLSVSAAWKWRNVSVETCRNYAKDSVYKLQNIAFIGVTWVSDSIC